MNGTTRPLGRGRVATAVLLAVVAAVAVGSAAPRAAADSPETAVLDWNKHALDALANAQVPPVRGRTPPEFVVGAGMTAYVQGVHLAMVQGAVYDAVNSIVGGYEPYLDDVPTAPSGASESAAVATAARDTLIGILNQAFAAGALPGGVRDTIVTRLQGLHAAALATANDGERGPGRRGGPSCRRSHARRALGGRTLRRVPVHVRGRPGRVATGRLDSLYNAAFGAERRLRLGCEGDAVRRQEQRAVPQQGPARAQQRAVHEGVQRSEGARGHGKHAHARAAGARRLLPGEPGRDVQPLPPSTTRWPRVSTSPSRHASSPSWRSRTGTRSSLLGEQGALEQLASADRDPARRRRRQPEDGRRLTAGRPPSRHRRIPTKRRATTARPARRWRSASSTSDAAARRSRCSTRTERRANTGTSVTSGTTRSTPVCTRGSTSARQTKRREAGP